MCGRIFADYNIESVRERLPFQVKTRLAPNFRVHSYNIMPSQNLVIITGDRNLEEHRWGITFRDFHIINSRIEEFFRKKLFTNMHRCVIPVTGFYEWTKQKKPFCFMNDHKILLIAGLFDEEGIVLMTKEANEDIGQVHHRMPVILETKAQIETWLSPKLNVDFFDSVLSRKESSNLEFYQVAPYVNNTHTTDAKCIMSLEEYTNKCGLKKFFAPSSNAGTKSKSANSKNMSLDLKNDAEGKIQDIQRSPRKSIDSKISEKDEEECTNAKQQHLTPMKNYSDSPVKEFLFSEKQLSSSERQIDDFLKGLSKEANIRKEIHPVDPPATTTKPSLSFIKPEQEIPQKRLNNDELFSGLPIGFVIDPDRPKKKAKRPDKKIAEDVRTTCDLRWFYDLREKAVERAHGRKNSQKDLERQSQNQNSQNMKSSNH